MNKQEERHRLFEDVEKDLTPDYGNWEVREDGKLLYVGDAIAYNGIEKENLTGSLLTHMFERVWNGKEKDAIDFYFAYLRALYNAGYKTLTIDLSNIHNIEIK